MLSLVGIVLAFSLLYWQAPNVDQQFRWVTPGSLLSTVALALLSFGFGIYVNLVGAASYAKTYGTAFGLILFLYFLYLASQVILLGAEFNAETTKRYDPETIRDKITDPRKQLPGEQPAPHPRRRGRPASPRSRCWPPTATAPRRSPREAGGPRRPPRAGPAPAATPPQTAVARTARRVSLPALVAPVAQRRAPQHERHHPPRR